MKISKIAEVSLYCDDVKPMLDFYQELFNFPVMMNSLPRSVFLEVGDNVLAIFNRSMTSMPTQMPPHHGANGVIHMAFEASSDDEYEEMKKLFIQKNIPIEKEIAWESHGGSKSFFFRDPAGNNMEVTQKGLWMEKLVR